MTEPPTLVVHANHTNEPATRVCSAGMRHALLARERAALRDAANPKASVLTPQRPRWSTRTVLASAACLGLAITAAGAAWSSSVPVAPKRADAARVAHAAALVPAPPASPPPASATALPAASRLEPANAGDAGSTPPRPSDAVAWLAHGDYARAVAAYAALRAHAPHERSYAVIHDVLVRRLAERCRGASGPSAEPCD